jgi:hypothetical protein
MMTICRQITSVDCCTTIAHNHMERAVATSVTRLPTPALQGEGCRLRDSPSPESIETNMRTGCWLLGLVTDMRTAKVRPARPLNECLKHAERIAGSRWLMAGVGLLFLVLAGEAVGTGWSVLETRRIDANIPTCSAELPRSQRCATERPGTIVRVQYLEIVKDSDAKPTGVRLTIQLKGGDAVVADVDNVDVDIDPTKIRTGTAVVGRFWDNKLGQIVFPDGTRVLVPPLWDSLKGNGEQQLVLFGIPAVGFIFAFLTHKALFRPRWMRIMLISFVVTISGGWLIWLMYSYNGVSDSPIAR